MKGSRYVKPFEKDVDKWERTLSLIIEVVEMILTVQRQWMYLEVPFAVYQCFCLFIYLVVSKQCTGKHVFVFSYAPI